MPRPGTRAWNKGAAGIDEMSIEAFPEFAQTDWKRIRQSLLAGTYQPLPVKRVEIPKATGGTRPLGIPTVNVKCTFKQFTFAFSGRTTHLQLFLLCIIIDLYRFFAGHQFVIFEEKHPQFINIYME